MEAAGSLQPHSITRDYFQVIQKEPWEPQSKRIDQESLNSGLAALLQLCLSTFYCDEFYVRFVFFYQVQSSHLRDIIGLAIAYGGVSPHAAGLMSNSETSETISAAFDP